MIIVAAVESYWRDAEERDLLYGPLAPTPDEAYDAARSREDRQQDHFPPERAPWMTPARTTSINPSRPVASPPSGGRPGRAPF